MAEKHERGIPFEIVYPKLSFTCIVALITYFFVLYMYKHDSLFIEIVHSEWSLV